VLVDAVDMPALMADADIALAAAGSTSWELAFMGLPAIVVSVADNQDAVADSLVRHGSAVSLGRAADVDPGVARLVVAQLAADRSTRAEMAAAGRALVDGRGAQRVVRAMETAGLALREATAEDAAVLFEWANDPVTRAASFEPAPIAWETHVAWLERSLASGDRLLFLAEDAGPVGQVRFDRESEDVAVISVSIAPAARGHGYAPAAIDAGVRTVAGRWPVRRVRAEIRADNAASLAAFADAGFGAARPLEGRADAVATWIEVHR
jgi:RimJ/RimL family protein N-acetyltransferase